MSDSRLPRSLGPLGAAVLVLGIAVSPGCQKRSLGDKARAAGAARVAEAEQAATGLLDSWARAMVELLPDPRVHRAPNGEPAMIEWRKVVAWQPLVQKAEELSARYEDTPARRLILDGLLVVQQLNDYWLGRVVLGLQELDELGEGKADDSDRVAVPLPEHLEALDELADRPADHPWHKVLAFERLLPHFTPAWRHLARGWGPARNDIPFMAPIFGLEPDDTAAEESYESWRDRLCTTLGDACAVPYELRDRVVTLAWIPRVRARLDAYVEQYGEWSLADVIARLRRDLFELEPLARVPDEYPVLPDTRVGWTVKPLSSLLAGGRGLRFESIGPGHDVSVDVLGPRPGWALAPGDAQSVAAETARLLADVERAGAVDLYTGELYLQWERDVPLRLLNHIGQAFDAGLLGHLWFVGRRRHDGSLRRAAFGGVAVPQPGRRPVDVAGGPGEPAWRCVPVAGLGGDELDGTRTTRHLLVAGTEVVLKPAPSPAPAAPVPEEAPAAGDTPAPLAPPAPDVAGVIGGDISAVRAALWSDEAPVLLAVSDELTYGALLALVDSLAVAEEQVARRMLLAICEPAKEPLK